MVIEKISRKSPQYYPNINKHHHRRQITYEHDSTWERKFLFGYKWRHAIWLVFIVTWLEGEIFNYILLNIKLTPCLLKKILCFFLKKLPFRDKIIYLFEYRPYTHYNFWNENFFRIVENYLGIDTNKKRHTYKSYRLD